MLRPKRHAQSPILKPMRPINCLTAEMWKDHKIYKAAGLLKVAGVSADMRNFSGVGKKVAIIFCRDT
jgi:hypothetical protein